LPRDCPTSAEQDVTATTAGDVLTMTHVNIVADSAANATCLNTLTVASLSCVSGQGTEAQSTGEGI